MRLVIEEPESASLRAVLADRPFQVASVLLAVEVPRAVRRVAPQLLEAAENAVGALDLIELGDRIVARAAELDPPAVRSLDAIHVATALEVGADLQAVVTYDARLAESARAAGLDVLAPG